MTDRDDDKTEGKQGSSGTGQAASKVVQRPGTRPVKRQGSTSPKEDMDSLDNIIRAGDEQDSTLNEGWEEPLSKGSRPKPVQKMPPDPWKKDTSSDDTGDSSCI